MKNLPLFTPSIPYYDNSNDNAAIDPTFFHNNDAKMNHSPYNQEEIINEDIIMSNNRDDQVKVCYEIGNNSGLEDSYVFSIDEDLLM